MAVAAINHLALQPGQPPPEPVFAPVAYRPDCDPDVSWPKLKKSVRPDYPPSAMYAGVHGTVGLRGVVEANGLVGEVRVVRSVDGELDREAIRTVKRFLFDTATLDGHAVAVIVPFEIEFALKPGWVPIDPRLDEANRVKTR
jgi:protein TonB